MKRIQTITESQMRVVPLRDLCRLDLRQVIPGTSEAATLPYVGMEDIESGTGRFLSWPHEADVRSNTFAFDVRHVLYGKLRPYLNKVALPDRPGRCSTELLPLLPAPGVDRQYVAWLLRRPETVAAAMQDKTGSRMPRASMTQLMALTFPLPSLAEQQRIVAKLDEQMAALDRAEKALAEQQAAALAFKRATLQTALDQAIHPEWECATLMDLCTFANGLWTGKKPPFQQASVIRNTNFTRDCTLDFSDIAHLDVEERQLRSRRLRTGDIILERSGGGPKQPVGRVALFELNDEFYSFSNFTSVIRVNERNGVLPRFLWYYLFHLYSSGVTEALQNHTSGIRNLDFSSYVMLSIPVPTLDEQRRVVEQLDWSIEQASNLLSYVAEQALTLASLRTSLLDAAFSGEISHD